MTQADEALARLAIERGLLTREQLGEAQRQGLTIRDLLPEDQLASLEPVRATPVDAPRSEKPHAAPFGRFTLLEKLGKGGMGVVYKAWDPRRHGHVAVKCMLETDDPTELKRFLREASTATSLSHPNICAVYEIDEHESTPYIVMELVEGPSLARRLSPRSREEKRMPQREALAAVRDIARALHHAHEHGIIHRDVKPENIMIAADGTPKLMDFGLAREVRHGATLTVTGSVMGTPYYMSPEQAAGRKAQIDRRCDIWALGVVLYQIATHRMPFEADTPAEILHKIVTQEPAPPRRVDARVPRDLETVVMKCLEPDAPRRYPTAAALAADLDRWLAGRPVGARPAGIARRLARQLRKRRGLALAVAAGVGAAAVAVAALLPSLGRARREVTAAQQAALGQLRQTTDAALSAALGFRQQGRIPEMERYLRQTEEACREAIRRFPDAAEPHHRLGRMYRAMMRDDEALAAQEEALKRDAALAPARYERALLMSRRYFARLQQLVRDYWRSAGAREDFQTAAPRRLDLARRDEAAHAALKALERELTHLSGMNLGPGEAAFVSGLSAWMKDQVDAARRFLVEAVEKNSTLEEACESLAALEEQEGRYEETLRWLTLGIERDRGYVPYFERRAWCRIEEALYRHERGEDTAPLYEAIEADLGTVLRMVPSRTRSRLLHVEARANRAQAEMDRGRNPEPLLADAVSDMDRLIAGGEPSVDLLLLRGRVRRWLGEWARRQRGDAESHWRAAAADFAEARRRDAASFLPPHNLGSVYSDLALAAARRGEDPARLFEQSIEAYTEAIKLHPPNPIPWQQRGQVRGEWGMWKMGRGEDASGLYEEACKDYDQAVERAPGPSSMRRSRAIFRLNWGAACDESRRDARPHQEFAIRELRELVTHRPRDEAAWRALGAASSNLGLVLKPVDLAEAAARFSEAAESYGAAISANPGRSESWSKRGDARCQFGLCRLKQGQPASDVLASAFADYTKAIELDARSAPAWFGRAEARYFISRSTYETTKKVDVAALRDALADCSEAVRLDPSVERDAGVLTAECRRILAEAGE